MTPGAFPRRVREQVLCGSPLPEKGWTLHHRRPRGMGGSKLASSSSAANGLAVHNEPCHQQRIEADRVAARENGWLLSQGGPDPTEVPVLISGRGWVLLLDDGSVEPLAADVLRPEVSP